MLFCDAHFHAADCKFLPENTENKTFSGICSAHSQEEFDIQLKLTNSRKGFYNSFGIHPQNPDEENYCLLEKLLMDNKILAIGETGFDFYTAEFKANRSNQEKAWNVCLELAIKYNVPIIIHNRKALDIMFMYTKQLKQISSVIFHSFAFSSIEAKALLKHGINAYFSFGKPLLNNNKKSIDCVQNLPLDRILMETDAPFQTLKGELATSPVEIERVYNKAVEIRRIDMDDFEENIAKNFCNAYNIKRESLTAS